MSITVKVDMREFKKTFKTYMEFSKRTIVEAVNQHSYYIARNATATTHAATKDEISNSLLRSSKDYSDVPLAAILVNVQRGKKGLKGLTGEKMKDAVDKFIRIRQSHRNFLRAGWIPAIKKLATVVPRKNGTKIPGYTAKKKRKYGGAIPAINRLLNWNIKAVIWNSATGNTHTEKSIKYLEQGAQKAVDMETDSMKEYIQRKLSQAAQHFNQGN